ncbi:hypothetical protein [Aquimarina sp. MMG016]|uniref:hypothetical protein n=1 Tax=Aquimarina sp. MMG016 TaxID=2822690 RepID=UPI001B3A37BE|nr:hypothetical protein [Aquimarina sp. MMG016]MBQ4818608.1 hypothetical protein [Aquimarina sp. MMG016]
MESHIKLFLKPFVDFLNQEISNIKHKYKTVKCYYSYGNENKVKSIDYNSGYLDELIQKSTENNVRTAIIDIDIDVLSPKKQRLAEIRFNQELTFNGKEVILKAHSLRLDEPFIIDYDMMNDKGAKELAKEYFKKVIAANNLIED